MVRVVVLLATVDYVRFDGAFCSFAVAGVSFFNRQIRNAILFKLHAGALAATVLHRVNIQIANQGHVRLFPLLTIFFGLRRRQIRLGLR